MKHLSTKVLRHSRSLLTMASLASALGVSTMSAAQDLSDQQDFATQGEVVEVAIGAGQFLPNKVTVHVGDTIRWTNKTAVAHTVTADPSLERRAGDVILPEGALPFHSGSLVSGAVFTQVLNVPGAYQYVCIPHELHGMIAQIEVLP